MPRYKVELKPIIPPTIAPTLSEVAYAAAEKCLDAQQPVMAFYYFTRAKKAGNNQAELKMKELAQKPAYSHYKNIFN